jgi:hypothetical protein
VRARPRSVARARSKIGGAEKGWRPSAGLTTSGGRKLGASTNSSGAAAVEVIPLDNGIEATGRNSLRVIDQEGIAGRHGISEGK